MATPSVARLGHVGLHVHDLEKEKAFFRDIVGLQVTDEAPEIGIVFMSAQPDEEHHELLLCAGRNVDENARVVQQVSFRCNSLDDVYGYYHRFREHGVRFDRMVSHGNAVSIYFYDPEGNRCEVYWNTGFKAKQPFGQKIDLATAKDELMAEVEEYAVKYGETGYVNREAVKQHNLGVDSRK
ncbi:MAG: VOC family protein [Candidatus Binataceae bacterium]|nr:VOC family protein [Candidatus Binataceae bacterium]